MVSQNQPLVALYSLCALRKPSPARPKQELARSNGVFPRAKSILFSLLQLFEPPLLRLYSKEMHDQDLQDQQTNH